MVSKTAILGVRILRDDLIILKEISKNLGLPVSAFVRSVSIETARAKLREMSQNAR
jgi:hypothetical protein